MKSSSSFHINLSKNVDITGNMSGLNKSLTWVRGELVITNFTNWHTWLFSNKYDHEHEVWVFWVRETIFRN